LRKKEEEEESRLIGRERGSLREGVQGREERAHELDEVLVLELLAVDGLSSSTVAAIHTQAGRAVSDRRSAIGSSEQISQRSFGKERPTQ
jgi:hypothetical protein